MYLEYQRHHHYPHHIQDIMCDDFLELSFSMFPYRHLDIDKQLHFDAYKFLQRVYHRTQIGFR